MIHLSLLGGACMKRDGELVTGRPAQSHHLALLAILAVAPGGSAGRERLLSLLWPEQDSPRSRHRLSVALHVLRSGLGVDCLLKSGDAVALNPAVVMTDVGAFLEAIGAGLLEEAARHYVGPFLAGFCPRRCAELERWIEAERARLAGLHESSLTRLAREAEKAGDPNGAAQWWQRLTLEAPFRASYAIRLVQCLEASGDIAGALLCARAHIARVEGELRIPANPEIVALADRLFFDVARSSR